MWPRIVSGVGVVTLVLAAASFASGPALAHDDDAAAGASGARARSSAGSRTPKASS